MARSGKKVMQFLSDGRYVANVVDGKVNLYGARRDRTLVSFLMRHRFYITGVGLS
jgi:hypothetical protein